MTKQKDQSLPFESSETSEQRLWQALVDLPQTEPSENLRRGFYEQLEKAGSPRLGARIRGWLGLSNNTGWATAAACMLMGFAFAQLSVERETLQPDRLAALEENMSQLNRELVLDRLQDNAPGTRLLGILSASDLVQNDPEIAQALLVRATEDRSPSVRSAAIDALGSQLSTAAVGNELMSLLESAESPIVQLALVDLVLRNGNQQQLGQLLELSENERLYPDLTRHVRKSLGRESI